MVLQRAPKRAVVWGFGDSSTLTILKMNDKVYKTISNSEPANAQNESIWSITLDPVSDEGPFDIHVSQPLKNGTLVTITIHDVLFGDVWICSGQSNMHMTVSMISNATEEIANAGKYPKIRVFSSALLSSTSPVEELLGTVLNWSVASPESIGGPIGTYFSAVCWLYGKKLHQALEGRPVGLISTSFGGTHIEVWMPPKALQDCNTTMYISNIIQFLFPFLFFFFISYRNADVTTSIDFYDELAEIVPTNYSSLYNSMIYPFMRTVIHGVIWYQGKRSIVDILYIFYSLFFCRGIK